MRKLARMMLITLAVLLIMPIQTVFGASDPQEGTASPEIENMIANGKSILGKTPYVYGGGHHDWSTQKGMTIPTGLDCSSFIAWAMYKGMGIDMGLAPVSGDFENYFDKVATGTLDGARRGDIIADNGHIEIYLGEDSTGKPMSLHAANERQNITITETNWGGGMTGKVVLRPTVNDAKSGRNGMKYDKSLINNIWSGETTGFSDEDMENTTTYTGSDADLYQWLNPMVDFYGSSNTHSKSNVGEKQIDSNNKGLKGHQQGIFEGIFGGF